MNWWSSIERWSEWIVPFIPTLLLISIVVIVLRLINSRAGKQPFGYRFREQLLVLAIVLAALIGVLLILPLEDSTQGQLLTFFGLMLTAIITLASPTVAANALAGFMLRTLGNFSLGDFIRVGEYFGRVTEQDLFHTEIQTEDRNLLTLPNLYLATTPVKVIHASGTIVSAEVSLGYDVDRHNVEAALISAAKKAELQDPFLYVMNLGDFSVTYRISGFLSNVKQLLTARSSLREYMLDMLHQNSIEIVSPSFMNQRQLHSQQQFIPEENGRSVKDEKTNPDAMVFDKAERAQQIKELEEDYAELKSQLSALDKSDAEQKALLERKLRRMKAIKRAAAMLERQGD